MKKSENELIEYHKQCAMLSGFTICSNGSQLCVFSGMTSSLFLFSKSGKDFTIFNYEHEGEKQDLFTGYCFATIDEIFLAPYNAPFFCVFSIPNEEFYRVDIAVENMGCFNHKFLKVIKYNNLLWVIGENIHTIICVDYMEGYRRKKCFDYETDLFWTYNHLITNESIFLPCRNKDVVLEINVLSEKVKKHMLHTQQGKGFSDIYSDDNEIILVGSDGELYRWDGITERIEENSTNSYNILSWYSCNVNGKVFRLSAYTSEFYICYDSNEYKRIELPYGVGAVENGVCFQGIYKDEEKIYALSRNGRLFLIDTTNESFEEVVMSNTYDNNDVIQNVFNVFANNNVCYEGYSGNLNNLISLISNI